MIEAEADALITMALQEDVGSGDITTSCLVNPSLKGRAYVVAKEELILAGAKAFHRVFRHLDPQTQIHRQLEDGGTVAQGSIITEFSGKLSALLTGERVALNFLQRLSGIATLTRHFVTRIRNHPVTLLDTRKTTPGWRRLEKYAVQVGGGKNHRMGLYDGILIKDNHIAAAGGISRAVREARASCPNQLKIEVEAKTLKEVDEALEAGADIIMLDNMEPDTMRQAVTRVNKRALTEASGRITLGNIVEVAQTGVDFISVGSITHSARAVDVSMTIEQNGPE
jgi:nicotinate-nucleotide pyrophosphorylase (carboxylating)